MQSSLLFLYVVSSCLLTCICQGQSIVNPLTDTTSTPVSNKVLLLHEIVGETIDSTEKSHYHLFPFWSREEFVSAAVYQKPDSTYLLAGNMRDGSVRSLIISATDLGNIRYQVSYYAGKIKSTDNTSIIWQGVSKLLFEVIHEVHK
ncbi:MAG: hypothetical protein K0S33_3372 [Bacteroidetes bacterium]|jgi:hypothetical protein|nr:hypothetical protein [Bacteroidota bacterium]